MIPSHNRCRNGRRKYSDEGPTAALRERSSRKISFIRKAIDEP